MGGKETGSSETANKLLSKEESSTMFNTVFTMSADPHIVTARSCRELVTHCSGLQSVSSPVRVCYIPKTPSYGSDDQQFPQFSTILFRGWVCSVRNPYL